MENVIVVLLSVSIITLLYLWLSSRTRILEFGILPEKLVRQLVVLERPKTRTLEELETAYAIGVPLGSQVTSRLPIRMYEGESDVIVLHPVLKPWQEDESLLVVDMRTKDVGKLQAFKLSRSRTDLENYALLKLTRQKLGGKPPKEQFRFLAVELLAPSFEIAGEKKQRQDLNNSLLTYTWGINAKSSGNQQIALAITLENESQNRGVQIGTFTHEIRVASVAHLTRRQVNILTGIVGIITALLAILEALQRLHVLP